MNILDKYFGDQSKRVVKGLQAQIQAMNALESEYRGFSDEQLKGLTVAFKERLAKGETLDQVTVEAFAAVREAARRALGQRHYDVQLVGGLVLHSGNIAEMKTGEGKTLVATLAAYLNALEGKGVHVVTVNDYLARRDADWMGRVYYALGVQVGCIQHQAAFVFDPQTRGNLSPEEAEQLGYKVDMQNLRSVNRPEAYRADITYGTNNEFGFDYLRDNMVVELSQKAQRGLHYAIIDEVDSILIDEARTPLIISSQGEEATDKYYRFDSIVATLVENTDYNLDEKMRASTLTQEGINKIEKALGVTNLYEAAGVETVHHIEQALKARALFKRDRDYVVKDGEVIIVDEFTGRMMHGRRYSEGLHQAIEAKEKLEIKRESRTLATITLQNLFRMYKKLAGMTGTAATEKEEFQKIYNVDVVSIPPNKQVVREDKTDSVYKSEHGKILALIKKVKEIHDTGRPILIGTISIEKNEMIHELLVREGIPHNVLNAKQHEKEAEYIAQAGRLGAVTVATNMAGRGVDIILGGNPVEAEEAKKVRELGGLVVFGTERHEARRIDNQLRGRSGRQGDPGMSQFFISMEDDLLRVFGSDRMKGLMDRLGLPEDVPIENRIVSRSVEQAQSRIEARHFDSRSYVVKYDDVMNKHRQVIYKKRNEVLESPIGETKNLIMEYVEAELEHLVAFHTAGDDEKAWDLKEIYETVHAMFPIGLEERIQLEEVRSHAGGKFADAEARTAIIGYVKTLAERRYEELEKRVEDVELLRRVERSIVLRAIDSLWMEHLDQMMYLREGIGLRGYGQRDPLVEYKKEAYELFTELLANTQKQVANTIFKVSGVKRVASSPVTQGMREISAPKTMQAATARPNGSISSRVAQQLNAAAPKVGRNDLCPCGSGKKFKKCHGQ